MDVPERYEGNPRPVHEDHAVLTPIVDAAPTPSSGYGFAEVVQRGRLDLTVEALVVQPQVAALFTDEELNSAERRLADCR